MTPKEFKEWRIGMGWTQREAAVALDIHTKTVSTYECGTAAIPKVVALATERLSAAA